MVLAISVKKLPDEGGQILSGGGGGGGGGGGCSTCCCCWLNGDTGAANQRWPAACTSWLLLLLLLQASMSTEPVTLGSLGSGSACDHRHVMPHHWSGATHGVIMTAAITAATEERTNKHNSRRALKGHAREARRRGRPIVLSGSSCMTPSTAGNATPPSP
eukprot:COSAG01_NODE_2085_length_8459_cov_14.269139_2_plen_160_part_00